MSSEVEVLPTTPTEALPVVEGETVHDSEEYESAEEIEGEEYEDEEVEEVEIEVEEEDDGKDKALDDDEDRKNPQFIPKKGYFYEHDDRMTGESGEVEEQPKKEEKPKKENKVITDRWAHDLFDENDQAPKSHAELEERYGYDIRKDDMAPRARRKRLYGRGPSKYTRKWEEEEAYQRPRGGFRGSRGGSRGRDFREPARRGSKSYDEDFPELPEDKGAENKIGENGIEGKGDTSYRGRRGGRGGGPATPRPRERRQDVDHDDEHSRDRFGRGQNRGGPGRGRGSRRNEFSNRNRYPDRRGSGPAAADGHNASNRPKTKEERDWEQRVDRIREEDRQKHANGTARGNNNSERDSYPSPKAMDSSKHQHQNATKKMTLPFTNTEYTGSASLTAHRNQEEGSEDVEPDTIERENISIKLVSAGPEQVIREVRLSEKDEKAYWAAVQGNRRSQVPPNSQQQHPSETSKPKRFSTQRQKQDGLPSTPGENSAPVSVAQVHGPTQPGVTSSQSQHVQQNPTSVPVSVISGYPPPQAYYEQVPVPIPTNYEAQGYEGSGSPISVPITAHGTSVSPSLWPAQHPGYSTSPYPSPPTGPPPVQTPYDPTAYISNAQTQIFAPPPHPHPQFISDPTIINYVPPGPPPAYGTQFHSQGFQGYPPVTPGPPELYHGGVTYYSPQNQMQRPHVMVPTKRPKSVLQLVEPSKRDMRQGPRPHHPSQEEALLMSDIYLHHYREESLPRPVDYINPPTSSEFPGAGAVSGKPTNEQQLSQKFEDSVTLQPKTEPVKKSPSPAPLDLSESQSWAEQMADVTPINSPSERNSPKNPGFSGSSQGEKSRGTSEATVSNVSDPPKPE